MNNFFKKSASYFVYLIILFAVIYVILAAMNQTRVQPSQLGLFLTSPSGYMLICLAVVISIAYPFFGFVKKSVRLRTSGDLSSVDKVMAASGYVLAKEDGVIRKYRPVKAFTRLRMLYNDTVTVDASFNPIVLDGNRTAVTVLAMRIENEQLS